MKKLMILAAMLAMVMVVAAPAIAQVDQGNDQDVESGEAGQGFEVTGGGGNSNACSPVQGVNQTGNAANNTGVIQSDNDDGEIELEDSGNLGISPENAIECKQEVNQAASAAAAPKPAPAPAPKPAPKPAPAPAPAPKPAPAPAPAPEAKAGAAEAKAAPAPKAEEKKAEAPKAEAKKAEEKKAEKKKELPKTGGSGTASLFALGAGTLLVAGGLLARRITK